MMDGRIDELILVTLWRKFSDICTSYSHHTSQRSYFVLVFAKQKSYFIMVAWFEITLPNKSCVKHLSRIVIDEFRNSLAV